MQLTIISDTHGQHQKLGKLTGEVLIHCGDMFNMFNQSHEDFDRMDDWFGEQDFDLILCTGGNHDFELQKRSLYVDNPFRNAVYLGGISYQYGGVTFFGAPWVPELYGQAFYTEDADLAGNWADIPEEVDVLITHTPPLGILDVSSGGLVLGCRYLMEAIERTRPIIHCFGHVHGSSGIHRAGGITYVNAALVTSQYELTHQPYRLEL